MNTCENKLLALKPIENSIYTCDERGKFSIYQDQLPAIQETSGQSQPSSRRRLRKSRS